MISSSMSTHSASGPDRDSGADIARAASELGGPEHAGEVLVDTARRAGILNGLAEVVPATGGDDNPASSYLSQEEVRDWIDRMPHMGD